MYLYLAPASGPYLYLVAGPKSYLYLAYLRRALPCTYTLRQRARRALQSHFRDFSPHPTPPIR